MSKNSNRSRCLASLIYKFALSISFLGLTLGLVKAEQAKLVSLVNPLQGTDSVFEFSHGNLYPAIATPFPMNAWAPYTQPVPDSFYYQYRQSTFRGIRQTHQPSPWIGDYGGFAFMPVTGDLRVTDRERGIHFSHDDEIAEPSYYKVTLKDYDASIEVTPTERCASFRVTYGSQTPSYLVIDAFPRGSSIEILPEENRVVGISRFNSGGTPPNFGNYFVIQFDQPFQNYGTWISGRKNAGQRSQEGEHVGAYLEFDSQATPVVTYRVASSYIGPEQAEITLEREIGTDSFDEVRSKAEQQWEEHLGRIRVEGGSLEQRRTFYSCFYRCLLFPHKFYELDSAGNKVHYSPYDGKLHDGVLYTDSGLWDTFRAVHPLFNLLFPEVNAEILQGMLNAYDQSGWLPAWVSPGHRECMIGNHAFSLFADAWVKGNRDFQAEHALEAMVHNSENEGPIKSIGRDGANYYRDLGYLPTPEIREATAKTLEFAYNDYCVSVLADALGRDDLAERFLNQSQNWQNVFDERIGFVRGREKDGSWTEPFHPDEWGGPFTEGNSWHWTWSVFHDIEGLIDKIGGRQAFCRKLDDLFDVPPTVRTGGYGGLIHEMTEMIAINKGQYAHGNQPIQHMIYLYVHGGQPWKAQQRIREVCNDLYDSSPKGYCGDEDNGQTSAWYVFSALGFYPVTPGDPYYVMGSPLFKRASILLPSGERLEIAAPGNEDRSCYIQSAQLNGTPHGRAWLNHSELSLGGRLELKMGPEPNREWASDRNATPPGQRTTVVAQQRQSL